MNYSVFLHYLQFEKRYSPHTILAYRIDLEQFFGFIKNTYAVKDIKEVDHHLIRSWMVSMMEQSIAARSVNRKIAALKTFFKFLLKKEIIEKNPMLLIQSQKTSKPLPVFVEKTESLLY